VILPPVLTPFAQTVNASVRIRQIHVVKYVVELELELSLGPLREVKFYETRHGLSRRTSALRRCPPTFPTYPPPAEPTTLDPGRPRFECHSASLSNNFTITERAKAQFQFQFYNIFNHVNLANPDGCVDCLSNGVNNRWQDHGIAAISTAFANLRVQANFLGRTTHPKTKGGALNGAPFFVSNHPSLIILIGWTRKLFCSR